MILDSVLIHTCDIYRPSASGNALQYPASATTSDASIRLEPISAEDILLVGGELTKSYKIYASRGTFLMADKVVIDSDNYIVHGIQDFNFSDGIEHEEVIVEELRGEEC